jgi:LPS-assembly protein
MKNSSLVIKFFIISLLNFILVVNYTYAKEVKFKAFEIETYDEGNLVIGKKDAEAIIDNEIEIFADKVTYNKKKELIIAEGNVIVIDLVNKIQINSEKIDYYKNKNQIISKDKTFFDIESKYKVNSSNVHFYLNENIIFSNDFTNVKDTLNNDIQVSSFKYFINDKILNGNNIELIDSDQNRYFLEIGKLRLEDYALLGKDIKILLRNDTFGIPENEPKLKGNSVFYHKNKTLIKKGIFTSCKENNNCPPWSITSKEIIHYKDKQEIHYKNAWLKLYNKPVLYFPKFFHPDPSVSRKSGFLMPTFGDSRNLGASVNTPYFHVISESEDMTFKPRFFSNTEYLLQSEFRKITKNSDHIADFSINKTDSDQKKGRKTHFFSNSNFGLDIDYFDESNFFLKIEKVSNDNYMQLYSLESTSPIIKDTSVLENIIEFSGSNDDFDLNLSLESYETMNKPNSDRFEFVYPNYSLQKSVFFENDFFNNLDFTSSGNQKKFSTNIYEATQVNNFLISSNNLINKHGFNNNFKTILKNVNTDGKNSSKLKDKTQSEILTLFSYDSSFPLIKESSVYSNLLTPKISARFSPNDTKNLKSETRLLDIDNIYSLDRIGFNETIEGGKSITLGLDFEKKGQKNNNTLFSSKIATVFRDEVNENLPITSTLGKKQSDLIGEINLNPNENFQFNYNYSLNDNLDEVNLHKIENIFTVNNFVNNFIFYEENNLIGEKSYYENSFTYNMNQNNSLTFKTRENKTDNLTEYYNLIYEYKTDCLTASIRYNKDYYAGNNLNSNEELFFNITLIPLGSTQTESILPE